MTPLNRLLADGASGLTNAELIATFFDGETETTLTFAQQLLSSYTDLHNLAQATPIDLQRLTPAPTAGRILATFELCKRLAREQTQERPVIASAADAAALLADMAYLAQENVRVLLLDINRRVIAAPTVYIGTLTTSVLRASEIYREAIVRGSAMLILAHNHPSGDPTPSPEDVEMTRSLAAAGRLLDIALVDHLIIGRGKWVSLREMGFSF